MSNQLQPEKSLNSLSRNIEFDSSFIYFYLPNELRIFYSSYDSFAYLTGGKGIAEEITLGTQSFCLVFAFLGHGLE